MSGASLTFAGHVAILSKPSTPIKEEPEMSNPSTVAEETPAPTNKRDQQRERDKEAWEQYLHLGSWVQVAIALNYANGSCARRAGHRHAERNNLLVNTGNPHAG